MYNAPEKQRNTCRFCRHCLTKPETRHLGLAYCARLQITVASDAAACDAIAPKHAEYTHAALLAGGNGLPQPCIYVLADKNENIIAHVLGSSLAPAGMDMHAIYALGCSLLLVARGQEAAHYASLYMHCLTLSDEYWTCSCLQDCIRHIDMRPCPWCSEHDHTGRCTTLLDVLRQEQARQRLT